jgi:signal transduction histidine kinase/DNA-binding response OmpR family regulator
MIGTSDVEGQAVLRALFPGDDESATLARATAWARTSLGEPADWSPELCSAVRTVMPSRIPMLLWWGNDLVQIYNEAYRPFLGSKHPSAMGQPAAECWAEVWEDLGPKVARVLEAGEATFDQDLLLFVDRHGYLEETYWTFSYSPVRSADGDVVGVFVATTDVTVARVETRRLDTIRDLAVLSSTDFAAPGEAVARVCDILATNRWAVPFAAIYLADPSGQLVVQCDYGAPVPTAALPDRVAAQSSHPLANVVRTLEPTLMTYRPEELRADPGPLGPNPPTTAYLMPLRGSDRDLDGVLVLGLNPYRQVDERYATFATLVTRQLTAFLADVRVTAAERARATALAELDRDKSAFFANVSHEFRTPITVALAATGELRRSPLSAEQVGHVDAVKRAAERLNRLVDALLDFARAEAGVLTPVLESVDLAETTRDVVSMFRSAIESVGLGLTVHVDDMGLAVTDREAWIKVVANLVSNAYKFTEHGSIEVTLRRDGDVVTLSVADTGTGITSDEARRVFDRFHLVTGQPARGIPGTGIGLALVKDLVEAQAGRVRLESTPGVGTTVTVCLPVAEPSRPDDAVSSADVGKTIGGLTAEIEPPPDGVEPPGRPAEDHAAHVLVVEDNADLRRYLTRLLTCDGWSVTAASDVSSALRIDRLPDIILSDVMLPGQSGLDLVRLIRSQDAWAPIPVVLLTARNGASEAAEGLAAGADDYVRKPFEPVELLSRLRTHYELAREHSRRLVQAQHTATHLQVALTTNRQIGVAVGVLMSREKVTSERAFDLLRIRSNQTNRKLRDVAEEVVLTGQLSQVPTRDTHKPVPGVAR